MTCWIEGIGELTTPSPDAATGGRRMKPPTVFLGEMTNPEVEAFLARAPDGHRPDGLDRAARPAWPAPDRCPHPDRGGPARRAAGRRRRRAHRSTTRCRTRTSGFTGVVHIRIPTFMALIEDLCALARDRSGFRRIVFLNGHYDNTYAIAYACANAGRAPARRRARLPDQLLGRHDRRRGRPSSSARRPGCTRTRARRRP